jgi:hypothetical protein
MLSPLSSGIFVDGSAVDTMVGDAPVGIGDAAVGGEVSVGVTETGCVCVDVDAGTQAAIKKQPRKSIING